jgi:hypothetical protein
MAFSVTAKLGIRGDARRRYLGHSDDGIDSTLGKGMTAQQPPNYFRAAVNYAKAINRFHGIFGASGHITARGKQQGRDCPFVSTEQKQHAMFSKFSQAETKSPVP